MVDFKETFRLIDKTKTSVTPITINGDATGNLLPWRVSCSVTSTGISKTNGGTIVLRIDANGTFVRNIPILNDQNAKLNFLIEYQISQDLTGGGTYTPGKLFRMEIRNSVIELVQGTGECLNLTCIEQQFRLKESYDSVQNYFATPQEEAGHRIANFNNTYGSNVLNVDDLEINFPNDTSLANNWLPQAPTSYHDLLSEVITVLASPPTAGGTLTDYYFDFDPNIITTKKVTFISGIYGNTSSGVTISPTSTTPVGMQTNQSNTLRNQNYKNQVILRGNSTSGSLPMETMRFNSQYTHAEGYNGTGGREIWDSSGVTYNAGDLVKTPLSGTNDSGNIYYISRYFTCILGHTSSPSDNPINDGTHWYEDFTIIPEWTPDAHYFQGDFVTVTSGGNVNFYIADNDIIIRNGPSPPTSSSGWKSIWSTKSTSVYQAFYSYTPWTSNLSDFMTNLAFPQYSSIDSNYIGFFLDWNFVMANYDPKSRFDAFSYVSQKWASYYQSSPPSDPNEIFEGQRVLVKSPGSGAFAGHDNCIAQYDLAMPIPGPGRNTQSGWHFSNPAVINDVVTILGNGGVLRYQGSNNWNNVLDLSTNIFSALGQALTSTNPFHLVRDIYLTTGASGIAAQAIEARFECNTPTLTTGLFNKKVFSNSKNATSRGMWLNFWFPYPRVNSFAGPNSKVGYRYGQNIGNSTSALGTLNTWNLDGNRAGAIGWNNGRDSEDMGRISGVHFKIKPSFYRIDPNTGNSIITQGYDNQAYTFWAVDMFDRVFQQDFQVPVNGAYQTIDMQFGANASQLLYFNRINDLQIFGAFTSPWNFFLREKEFTGVAFDWRFVKCCGWQWKGANDETGQYKLMIEQTWAEIVNQALQAINSATIGPLLATAFNIDTELDYTTLALDEFYFIKELYVNSSDVVLNDPRVEIVYDDSEPDYYNAKAKAQAKMLRDQYYPLFTTYESTGDVRLRFGLTFNIAGTRVLGGTDTLVCSEVTHTVDKNGYNMSITGVKKFVLPIITLTPASGPSGTMVTIVGSNFSTPTNISIMFDNILVATIFSSGGITSFTQTFDIPSDTILGIHTFTATDNTSGIFATAPFLVTS